MTRVQSSGGLRRCSMSIISSWLIWLGISILAHILTQPPSATSTHAPPKAAFIHHTLILLFETLHRKHILRSWVSLSTPPTGCTTCDTKHYTKPAARKHTTCHIQGICVSAPSGGPRHFEGNKLRAHLFRPHFPNISKYLADCFNTSILK